MTEQQHLTCMPACAEVNNELPGRGTQNVLANTRALSAASTMRCARTARAMALPESMCYTALDA